MYAYSVRDRGGLMMYRLLIVDDEPIILNGLQQLFQREMEEELEVMAAASAQEALEWLGRTKIDIVLSDIRMPGMDGLALHRHIMEQWPKCKVIFLTGYSDFSYIQQAIRQGSVDYILKTEGNAKLLESIRQAVSDMEEEQLKESFIMHIEKQMNQVLPFVQKQFFNELLQGEYESESGIKAKCSELKLVLDAHTKCLLLTARIDDWGNLHKGTDQALIHYGIENISRELLSPLTRLEFTMMNRNRLVWLIQPLQVASQGEDSTELWAKTYLFVREMVDELQSICLRLLKLPLSFALAAEEVRWMDVHKKFEALSLLFHSGLGIGKELILLEPQTKPADKATSLMQEERLTSVQLNMIEYLKACMENGQKESYFDTLKELLTYASQVEHFPSSIQLELYFLLVSVLLPRGLHRVDESGVLQNDYMKMIHFHNYSSWHQFSEDFIQLSQQVFQSKLEGMNVEEDELIQKIQAFVEANMSGDLSLTRISEVVGHNPAYLSRLYKKLTKQGLSTYIQEQRLEKAKLLISENKLKMHEISAELGFMSSQYFHRFFKKATNLTPQEYRDLRID